MVPLSERGHAEVGAGLVLFILVLVTYARGMTGSWMFMLWSSVEKGSGPKDAALGLLGIYMVTKATRMNGT